MQQAAKPGAVFIGYVWPEPRSSAAGSRVLNLVRAFREAGWKVDFISASKDNEHRAALESSGIPTHLVELNHPGFDALLRTLAPQVVVFDRFVTEEQFGWRVREHAPSALRLLDTQDLHFLRRARETALRTSNAPNLRSDDALRELSSISRSDLTLVISRFEHELLLGMKDWPINSSSLIHFPLLYDRPLQWVREFDEREGIAMIGNFRHPPNLDGVFWFIQSIWPEVRKRLPSATIHLYGAYPPREIMALDRPAEGVRAHGWVPDQFEALARHRVSVAPLRFGAGQKGKIADSWWTGTPIVTTSIGLEGMLPTDLDTEARERFVADDPTAFAEKVEQLYTSAVAWRDASALGRGYIIREFLHDHHSPLLIEKLKATLSNLESVREANLLGRILWFNSNRATEYFGRWLELKSARAGTTPRSP